MPASPRSTERTASTLSCAASSTSSICADFEVAEAKKHLA